MIFMHYFLKHPLKSLKVYLPQSMFGRSLLILVLPLVLIETVAGYVFIDSHWERVTKNIAQNIVGEVAAVKVLYESDPTRDAFYRALAGTYLKLGVQFVPGPLTAALKVPEKLQDTPMGNALKNQFFTPYTFDIKKQEIFIETEVPGGLLKFTTPRSRFCSKAVLRFVMWVSITSAVFLLIAVAFMHNQVKPLRRLAIAADRFGKGRSFPALKPEGAIEIRKLTHAFMLMRERLHKQLTQRTEMLAGVSHDLRTPLTRMGLQLAMMGPTPEIEGLQKDVEEMGKMLEGYLAFARGEGQEEAQDMNINELLAAAIEGRENPTVTVEYQPALPPIFAHVKPQAMKRCVMNLLNNGTRYGKKVWVSSYIENDCLIIAIEDNGPGISEEKIEEVFKPFSRLESSRNVATGGVGLGLTIARDIAQGHGGEILLSTSTAHGGLKAMILLPH